MSYIRTQITSRVKALLETINTGNGYSTNIGGNVLVALRRGNQHDAPCVYLIPDEERGDREYGISFTEADYVIAAVVNRVETFVSGSNDEHVLVDALIADVRNRMESNDATLTGLMERLTYNASRPIYHEDGGELIGAEVTYSITFLTQKGDVTAAPA